ncbi:PGPGW domain-containing protein [Cellulomonas sp. S1-8]|uniref:PGPGW domain-containing protein n=1 Tax=Cellulomonas sp. S1-8 TaxID=2904790 RepID=UPI0022433D1C|nr:PGPGW domain-containing protein [Cellulomonas sp. S1-8]UZN02511.1 PGPGW domain-containing protein [Cellulomonas sp. S1-8]
MAGWADRWAGVRARIAALPRPVRVVAVSVVGWTLILAGVAMLVLPGQGVLTIIAGLALLATEFAWAHRMLARVKAASRAGVDRGRAAWGRRRGTPAVRTVVVDETPLQDGH